MKFILYYLQLICFERYFVTLQSKKINIAFTHIIVPIVTIRNSNFNRTDRAIGGFVPMVRSDLSFSKAVAGLGWCGSSRTIFDVTYGKLYDLEIVNSQSGVIIHQCSFPFINKIRPKQSGIKNNLSNYHEHIVRFIKHQFRTSSVALARAGTM